MPITGNETALANALTSAISSAISAKSGQAIQNPEYIDALSTGIANAIIPFLVSNTLVNTNDVGTVTSGPGSGGAVIATGTGTIS